MDYLKRLKDRQHFIFIPLLLIIVFIGPIRDLIFTKKFASFTDASYLFHPSRFSYLWFDNYRIGFSAEQGYSLFFLRVVGTGFLKSFLPDYIVSQILFIFPIFLVMTIFYIVITKLTKRPVLGFVSALLIYFNNQSLEYILYGQHLELYVAQAIIMVSIYLLKKAFDTRNLPISYIVIFALMSFFITYPLFLILYSLFIILGMVFHKVANRDIRRIGVKILLFALILFLVSSCWILPFLNAVFSKTGVQRFDNNAENVLNAYVKNTSLNSLLNHFSFGNTEQRAGTNGFLNIFVNYLLLFLLVVSFLRIRKTAFNIFLFTNYIFFLLLALAPNVPFVGHLAKSFLSSSIGLLFRSFPRFSIILMPINIYFVASLFKHTDRKYHGYATARILIIPLIALVLLANPIFFKSNYDGALRFYKIPQEYYDLNKFLDKDAAYGRVVMFPNIQYESFNWNNNDNNEFFKQNYYFSEYFLSKPNISDRSAYNLQLRDFFAKVMYFDRDDLVKFSPAELERFLLLTSSKYIMVHKDFVDILSDSPAGSSEYNRYFSDHGYATLMDNDYFTLYQNDEYYPVIYTEGCRFKRVNNTKVEVEISNLTDRRQFIFLETYNNAWRLYLEKAGGDPGCEPVKEFAELDITECQHTERHTDFSDLQYLWRAPVFEDTHRTVMQYANGWMIDPEYVKQHFSKDYYVENPDGSIDIRLVLYFKAQSFFSLGLIVSVVTMLSCLGFLFVPLLLKRRRRPSEMSGDSP